MNANRRQILRGTAATFAAAALSTPAVLGQSRPRVVVIGGGAGGATAARYIAKDSDGAIEVVLVEPSRQFTTCFHSNLYLGGFRSFQSITHGYDAIAAAGVALNHQAATAIDQEKKTVSLADGSTLSYDRLVVSPGIDFKYGSVPGWDKKHEEVMPHAWKAGRQTRILKARLDAVPDGALIVMITPLYPYRCPPAPYERASMMASTLKATGKTRAKIIIVDPKVEFSKQRLFYEGWEKHYNGMVEWIAPDIHNGVKSVDPSTNTVETSSETYKNAALVNVIPGQMAGRIARDAGLADDSGFCPIEPATMKSANNADIFVIGDASIAGDMPKSAYAANSQAKVAAMTIRSELTGVRAFPARYSNICWSIIGTDDAVKIGGRYEPKDGKITQIEGFISQTGEPADLRRRTQEENMAWYASLTHDIFG
jgi:sulfide dehydrogenase [flavocytochrome c] flavoprotein chain